MNAATPFQPKAVAWDPEATEMHVVRARSGLYVDTPFHRLSQVHPVGQQAYVPSSFGTEVDHM